LLRRMANLNPSCRLKNAKRLPRSSKKKLEPNMHAKKRSVRAKMKSIAKSKKRRWLRQESSMRSVSTSSPLRLR